MPAIRGHWQLIDRTGQHLTKEIEGLVSDFHEDRAWFRPGEEGWGCLDATGKVVIETRFSAPLPFSEGLARAAWNTPNGLFGFLDKSGRWAIEPKFITAQSFSQGLAAVCVEGDLAYSKDDYNKDHNPTGGRWGYINRLGEWVFPPQFDQAGPFIYGVAKVVKQGRVIYVNLAGEVIFDAGPEWSTAGYTVIRIPPDSTAEKLGLQINDVLLRIDDIDLLTSETLDRVDYSKERTYYVGRNGKIFTVDAPVGKLGARIASDYTYEMSSTITDDIAETTPPIERTEAEIVPYVAPEDTAVQADAAP